MLSCLGRWILEDLAVYNPFSGVTTNQSESFNATLKRLNSWREVPLDGIVLSLYHLQAFYLNETQRGFAGIGSYTLVPELVKAQRSVDDMILIPTYHPDEIVNKIQQKSSPFLIEKPSDQDNTSAASDKEACNSLLSTQHSRAR